MPKPTLKKIAIVHDCYLHEGGAERVLQALLTIFPKADVYIPLITQKFATQLKKTHRLFVSSFNYSFFHNNLASLAKPFITYYFEHLNLKSYDLVISSSHSFSSKSVKIHKTTKHISYIHTPPRYLYKEYNEMNWIKNFPWNVLSWPLLQYLRKKDLEAAKRPDVLIANSKEVQARIKKYYHRQSLVIYPPVDLPTKKILVNKFQGGHYLFHSRLVKQKGAELAIRTFNQLNLPLVIVGTGEQESYLKKIAGTNIKFSGFISDKKLKQVYAHAKALIYCAIDEDFGLVPVEALARSAPVIAYNSGGVKETMIDGTTGVLFDEYSVQSLSQAVMVFNNSKFQSKMLQKQARKFSMLVFANKIKSLVFALE